MIDPRKLQKATCSSQNFDSADAFLWAKGEIPYSLTNDYMFKVVLGNCPLALKGLICALLHMKPEDVLSVDVMNPITPGDSVDTKDMVLDLKICLNDSTLINLEMQLVKQGFWPERSLSYLCRTFNHLKEGESYWKIKPAIHIGFVDFDIAPEEPEFYATYHLANDKTHRIYTNKFTLSVVNLKQIKRATPEDQAYQIDRWAELFKSTTWEEIQMLAEKNTAITEVAKTMYQLTGDDLVRERCQARQDHYRDILSMQEELQEGKRIRLSMEEELQEGERIRLSMEEELQEGERIRLSMEEELQEGKRIRLSMEEELQEGERIRLSMEKELQEGERIRLSMEEELQEGERIRLSMEEELQEGKRIRLSMEKQLQKQEKEIALLKAQIAALKGE